MHGFLFYTYTSMYKFISTHACHLHLQSHRLFLGRCTTTEESRGGTWKEPTTEKVMITTNPSRLSSHKPFDRLTFNRNAKIRKHVREAFRATSKDVILLRFHRLLVYL